MRNKLIIIAAFLLSPVSLLAQQDNADDKFEYRRGSIYSLLISHPDKPFNEDIADVFKSIPLPDKFNDHNLKIRVVKAPVVQRKGKGKKGDAEGLKLSIDNIIETNAVGRRLVAQWFNRDSKTGACDMDLIFERGYYDASFLDINLADISIRGRAQLADAGEELIGQTFLIANDIRYVDKEDTAGIITGVLSAASDIAGAGTIVEAATALGATISDQIAGFRVVVTTHLYQLEWSDEAAMKFYQDYYMDSENTNLMKMRRFDMDRSAFKLKYLGSQTVASGNTSLKGVNTKSEMIRKVCTRALNESVANLQKEYDDFKIKTAITSVDPITAYIGKKEGINEDSMFEVLEVVENENGVHTYNRVGVVSPINSKIWDNRYLADADGFKGSELTCTTFKKVSGKEFYPGMLIREIK